MATVDFLPWAIGPGANVLSQADYLALPAVANGVGYVGPSEAVSQQLNKTWRQSSFVAAAIATLMSETLGINVLDDANLAEFVANLKAMHIALAPRQELTAPRTYYVAPNGNDNNDGLTPGTPFLTIQRAINLINSGIDAAGQQLTIQMANGTYPNGAGFYQPINGALVLQGNLADPAQVVIDVTNTPGGGNAILAQNSAISVSGMTVRANSGSGAQGTGYGILANPGGSIVVSNIIFSDCATAQLTASKGYVDINSNYSINGNAPVHWLAILTGAINPSNNCTTVTCVGTRAFSTAFAMAAYSSTIAFSLPITFPGGAAATGSRYNVQNNGVISTGTGNPTLFPGNAAGTGWPPPTTWPTATPQNWTGGQYT
jgi:hypothetical protein